MNESKPPYTIPTMREIRALAWNGRRVVSTFAGGGGSSTGYRMAGFRVAWANEYVPEARATYAANYPETPLDARDIRDVQAREILAAIGLDQGELDVLDGSPPCASFSTAGARDKHWGQAHAYSTGEAQVTDDLFFEYVRLLRGLQPRAFVAENVSGLVKGTAKGYFKDILAALTQAGYVVRSQVLDAAWLGVPQRRARLIFVGVRRDLAERGLAPAFPTPLAYQYTLLDALPELAEPDPPEVTASYSIERFAIGEAWKTTPYGESSERYFQLVRAHPHRPVNTITAVASNPGAASVTHPYRPRKFTREEIARLCSFPEDYVFPGTNENAIERMGRAVPPLMMRAVARVVETQILARAT